MSRKTEFLIVFAASLGLELLAAIAYADATGRQIIIANAVILSALIAAPVAWVASKRASE